MQKNVSMTLFKRGRLAWVVSSAAFGLACLVLLSHVRAEPGAATAPTANVQANEDPDAVAFFEQQVRPILEKRCVRCHGGEKVSGELNFATRELFLKGGESGALIDWEKQDKSLLLRAINYSDVDYEMPPTGKMPQQEIETLSKWVAMGLPWTDGKAGYLADPVGGGEHHDGPLTIEEGKDYWAYKPLVKPEQPKVDDPAWSQNPIDAFIYAKLAEQGLKPNHEADRVTLIRRATYNLTGLPPTPEEITAFINDDKPGAWERVIDRLLASPHYGEQWARHWMDIARYAETNGYERDDKKRNIWRYRDYLIRSFNDDKPYDRFVQEHVAGDLLPDRDAESYLATGFNRLQIWDDEPTDREQARADYIADIVDTTSGAFLATTMGCARCHDHKKDPIHQSDYFALYAFYNNIQEMVRGREDVISKELRDLPRSADQRQEIERWEQRVAELNASIAQTREAFKGKVSGQFNDKQFSAIAPDSREELQSWRYTMQDPGKDWHVQQFDDSAWATATGGFGMDVDKPYFPNRWETDAIYLRKNFRLTEVPAFLFFSTAHEGGIEVYINGIKVHDGPKPTGPDHIRVQFRAAALDALVVGSNAIAIKVTKAKGQRRYVDFGMYAGVVEPEVALLAAIDTTGQKVLGKEVFETYKAQEAELNALVSKPVAQPYPALVLNELGREVPKQHIHLRGSAHAEGDEVPARFPLVLGGQVPTIPDLPGDIKANGRRLVLAQWLTSPENPLAARVMANRLWQHQFGRGIVRTSSDFGQLGEQPTHPELLNYLAAAFIERDWSIKQMHRLIMTSKTYRMASSSHAMGMDKDPANNLFWRYDMRRLSAEEFRDSLLAVNGSLNRKMFGPSIYTKMPAEVLATASRPDQAWGNSSEEERDRRSVYIHIKRSLREPLMLALDQAETDTPCPVRFATTVPTQSLITLNSEVMQEESAVFAKRLLDEAGPKLEDQVRLGLYLVLCREPEASQVAENVAFIESIMKEHGLSRERAMELFCLVAYNLNEFVYLD